MADEPTTYGRLPAVVTAEVAERIEESMSTAACAATRHYLAHRENLAVYMELRALDNDGKWVVLGLVAVSFDPRAIDSLKDHIRRLGGAFYVSEPRLAEEMLTTKKVH